MRYLTAIIALILAGCSSFGPQAGREPDKVSFDPGASIDVRVGRDRWRADGLSDYTLEYGEFKPRDIEIIIPKSMLQSPEIDRGDHLAVPYRIDPSNGFSLALGREGTPTVTRGGWYAGIIARITALDYLQWIIGIVILGVLLKFFWPVILRIMLWTVEGFGAAVSRQTFTAVVKSVQDGRQAAYRVNKDAGKALDTALLIDQDQAIKDAIEKLKKQEKIPPIDKGDAT